MKVRATVEVGEIGWVDLVGKGWHLAGLRARSPITESAQVL